jgi:hypothetical protein
MPKTEEIPRSRWIAFLDDITREHQGTPVSLEILDPELGAQPQLDDVPLQGISADERPAGSHDVNIIVGEEVNPPVTHIVPHARRLYIARSETGDDQSLEIEGNDGSRTIVRFELPRAA